MEQPKPQLPGPSIKEHVVDEIRTLLGSDTLLLRWPLGTKGSRKKWGHLNAQSMTPAYLRKLATGNIGVAMGAKSGGLCVVDADTELFATKMLECNPFLKDTLQTRG